MDGKQNILDCVFHVVWIAVSPRRERTQVGHDFVQETIVGCSVAILGAGHENAPVNVPDDRLGLICAVGAAAPVCPDELQRWHAAARLLGHRQQAPRCSLAGARISVPPCHSKQPGITCLLARSEAAR